MYEHSSDMLSNCTNMAFSDAILVMGINATEFDALALLSTTKSEVFGGKNTIISMVTFDGPIMMRGKKLKAMLSSNCFLTSSRNMWSKMKEATSVVNK